MNTAIEYRETAIDCYRMAEESASDEDRRRWERIGDRCIRKAMELERAEEVSSIPTSAIEQLTQGLRLLSARSQERDSSQE
jgi:hypothetical protein